LVVFASIFAVTAVSAWVAFAQEAGRANVIPNETLQWVDAGIPGVSGATVAGDMKAGPSRFYWKYKAGFVAPLHHHTADHFVSTISGTLVLITDGKENKLAPGSYFSLTGKKPHGARCEGAVDCVMFIEAHAAWDIVPEAAQP